MQPELSHWNPKDALESEESYHYYKKELAAIIEAYANHPSFVALTLGNELHNHELGHARMVELVEMAQQMDNTRMYAIASNGYYGEQGCDETSVSIPHRNIIRKKFADALQQRAIHRDRKDIYLVISITAIPAVTTIMTVPCQYCVRVIANRYSALK